MVIFQTQQTDGPQHPVLVAFQGCLADDEEIQVNVSSKGVGKKRKRIVATNINGIVHSGTDFGDDSIKNDTYNFAVGILDEDSQIMKISPVGHAFVLKPQLKAKRPVARNSSETSTYLERKQSLTEEFGSRKKKRALKAAQSNIILPENISGGAAVEQAMANQVVEDIAYDDSAIFTDAADQAIEENRLKLLPTFDATATTAEDVYPLGGIIAETVMKALERFYTMKALEPPDTKKCDDFDVGDPVIDESSALIADAEYLRWANFFKRGRACHVILSRLRDIHLVKSSKRNAKILKENTCHCLYLYFQMRFLQTVASDTNLPVSKVDVAAAMCDAPCEVVEHLEHTFGRYKKYRGQPAVVCSKDLRCVTAFTIFLAASQHIFVTQIHRDSLLLRIVVLALTLSSFSLDLTLLAAVRFFDIIFALFLRI